MVQKTRGLFITGTDTEIGKTYVAALVAASLARNGHRVGVYKPAASDCSRQDGKLVSDDALALWKAAGMPGTLDEVCPQVFASAKAPHLAAADEGKQLDAARLRSGIEPWLERSDVVIVEGAGGLMSPLGQEEYVADLAYDLGFPLVIVADNRLGAINHVLQTLIAAAAFREGLDVAGIVLNSATPVTDDAVQSENHREIAQRAASPVLARVGWRSEMFEPHVDWFEVARTAVPPAQGATEESPP